MKKQKSFNNIEQLKKDLLPEFQKRENALKDNTDVDYGTGIALSVLEGIKSDLSKLKKPKAIKN
ncbi:MAG: hypothetical protein K9I94_03170 [Bacteroidales bacterium]|nr:hypothetical protein [Bacteroidales bacterium]